MVIFIKTRKILFFIIIFLFIIQINTRGGTSRGLKGNPKTKRLLLENNNNMKIYEDLRIL